MHRDDHRDIPHPASERAVGNPADGGIQSPCGTASDPAAQRWRLGGARFDLKVLWLLRAVLLVLAFALMLAGLGEPLRGTHTFRQSHVAANIEKYIADGLSLVPSTYNLDVPGHLFGFPAYQLVVAWLCRAFDFAPLPTARAVNIAVLALVLLLTDRLLAASHVARSVRLSVGISLIVSPLNLFYYQVPIGDPLAILASLVSLVGYVRWDRRPNGREGAVAFAGMLAGGVLATVIKNPVYFPFCIAIVWHRWYRRGWRGLVSPGFTAFAAAMGATVLGFQLFSDAVNHPSGFLAAEEANAFGSFHWYLRPPAWARIARSLLKEVLPPFGSVLALVALAVFARRTKTRYAALYTGLMIGVVSTLVIFFNHERQHDYYQLPFVLPFAFFSGFALHLILVAGRAARRAGRRRLALCALPSALLLVLLNAATGYAAYRGLLDVRTDLLRMRGAWVREHTRPDDFVIFVTGPSATSWNPEHLYHVKRDGYNLPRRAVGDRALVEIYQRFGQRYSRVLVFVPQARSDDLCGRLAALGAGRLAEHKEWALFELPSQWQTVPPIAGTQ